MTTLLSPNIQSRQSPFVAGILAPEHQILLSQTIVQPPDIQPVAWDYGEKLQSRSLPDNLLHLLPVVRTIVRAAQLTPRSEREFLMMMVFQQPADTINSPGFSWHKDSFHKDFRRAVVSDRLGTRYRTLDGSEHTTPDYGILVLNEKTSHAPNETVDDSTRTLLLISRMLVRTKALFDLDYFDRYDVR